MSKGKLAGIIIGCIVALIVIVALVARPPGSEVQAEFELSNLAVSPSNAEPGETITVTIDMTNTGKGSGSCYVEMKIDGAIKDAKTVTINAGETTSASFVVHEPILGSHSVQIAGLAAGFLVVEPEPAIITLHGTGTRATTAFTLERGLSIFHMVHRGTSNFIVWLYDTETGERVDLLANVIGSYDGSVVVGVTGESTGATPGEHLLDIDADGSWEVTIEQPRPVTAPSAPQTFTGTGPAVPQPFRLEAGTAIFHMSHQGTSNFAIWLYDRDGHRVELLVNEIGTFDGSTIVGVTSGGFGARPGIHYIAIDADGTWQVTLQQ